jgi:hypothetical protein
MPNTPTPRTESAGHGRVVRIQRSRAKGWRMPPGALYVGRPTRFGNPFTVADALTDDPTLTEAAARERCASLFGLWLTGEIRLTGPAFAEQRAWILGHVGRLAERDLACWCPIGGPCHADVLIEMANRGGRDG